MISKTVFYLVVGVWLLVAVVVVVYPLRTGQIRVGVDPVSRETDPKAFWGAYIISTLLFLVISAAVGLFMRRL
jgi:hypothetical protein